VPPTPKYSPQHPILKNPQFTFLPHCERPKDGTHTAKYTKFKRLNWAGHRICSEWIILLAYIEEKITEFKISEKQACGKTAAKTVRQHQEELLVAGEYKRIEVTSKVQRFLEANY